MKDSQSFKSIYLEYYPQLVVYGRTITPDEHLVEDAIQELFLTLWQKKDTHVFHTAFDSYIFVALRNNLVRKIQLQQRTQFDTPAGIPPTEATEPDYKKEEKLASLIQQLPPRQKEVLFLRYYKNHSYHEIADSLGINYQVARNFSYRAIQFLKKKMKQTYFLF